MLEYLFVEGKDVEQILDGIQGIIKNGFNLTKQKNILKLNDMYVYISY